MLNLLALQRGLRSTDDASKAFPELREARLDDKTS